MNGFPMRFRIDSGRLLFCNLFAKFKVYCAINGVNTMQWTRDIRTSGEVIKINSFYPGTGERGEYLTFPSLENTGIIRHLITTRLGGVSEGEFSTMNFNVSRGDKEEHVREN